LKDEISQRAAEYIFHKKELEEEKETVETEISKLEQLLSELQERKRSVNNYDQVCLILWMLNILTANCH
jgi:chromosome segregation ATPase